MSFLSDLADEASGIFDGGLSGLAGKIVFGNNYVNPSKQRDIFAQIQEQLPSMGIPAQQGDQIGQLIAKQNPETQPDAMQRYQSALLQLAQISPRQYGGAALQAIAPPEPLTPMQEMDMQIKNLQLQNLRADQQMQATKFNFDMQRQRAEDQRRNDMLNMLSGIPTQTSNFNPSIPTPVTGDRPNIDKINSDIASISGFAPNNSGQSMNEPLSPQDMQRMVQQYNANTQIQQQPQKQVQPTNKIMSVQEWSQSPVGKLSVLSGDPDKIIKAYSDYYNSENDRQNKLQDEQNKIANSAKTDAVSKVNQVDRYLASMQDTANELLNQKGFNYIFGPINSVTPNLYSSSADAQAKLDALASQESVRALQEMRANSPTGGAVGQVTEKEWPRLESTITSLSQKQSPEEARKSIKKLQSVITSMRNGYRQAAGMDTVQDPNVIQWDSAPDKKASNVIKFEDMK